MIADKLLESMVLLRREVCFDRTDAIFIEAQGQRIQSLKPPSPELKAMVYQFNAVDTQLYQYHVNQLQIKMEDELYFQEELDELAKWNREAALACAPYATEPQMAHKKWMSDRSKVAFKKLPFRDRGGQSFPEDNSRTFREKDCRPLLTQPQMFQEIVRERAYTEGKAKTF
jgi:hypothetical protein